MSKEEIKNLLIEFVCEYDFTSWSNDKVYEKFSDLIYKQISDLEAKLAKNKKWLASNEGFLENQKLKQQLADAEEHIDNLEVQLREQYQLVDEKDKQIKKLNKRIENQVNNSYKIIQNCKELQIEQLEKVKEIMSKSNESGYIIRFASMNDRDKFNETIDNQISELTHQHEE